MIKPNLDIFKAKFSGNLLFIKKFKDIKKKTKLGTIAIKNHKIYFEYSKEFLKIGI